MRMGEGGEKEWTPPIANQRQRQRAGGVPLSARALPGSAAICERDRSSFQKLFLLWDLALGGDQQEAGKQEEQRPAAWRSVFFLPFLLLHLSRPHSP